MSLSFIDTNILVYAHDSTAGEKHEKAREVLRECWLSDSGCISIQVLQEFYITVTRKLPKTLPKQKARDIILTYRVWPVFHPSVEDLIAASNLEDQHGFSFWDALIVRSAQGSGADKLISEDMQGGRMIGGVEIINPP